MSRLILLLWTLSFYGTGYADVFDDIFSVVYIDQETEKQFGSVPLDRQYIARAIEQLSAAGATGVILKFFLDQEKDVAKDERLARSFMTLPVLLQARIDNDESHPQPLAARFFNPEFLVSTIEGQSGWIPAPLFMAKAHDIGFVDFVGFPIPLFVNYQGKTTRSLLLAALELALGEGQLQAETSIRFSDRKLLLDRYNRVAIDGQFELTHSYIPFHQILSGERLNEVKGKIVVVGYYGPKIHSIATTHGKISAHVLFVNILRHLVNSISD